MVARIPEDLWVDTAAPHYMPSTTSLDCHKKEEDSNKQ